MPWISETGDGLQSEELEMRMRDLVGRMKNFGETCTELDFTSNREAAESVIYLRKRLAAVRQLANNEKRR